MSTIQLSGRSEKPNITSSDIVASNGIIHLINEPMWIPDFTNISNTSSVRQKPYRGNLFVCYLFSVATFSGRHIATACTTTPVTFPVGGNRNVEQNAIILNFQRRDFDTIKVS